jgi:GNAT superfamily N-acetyltransferase
MTGQVSGLRRVADLGAAELGSLPTPCRNCLFWESGADGAKASTDQQLARKEAWWCSAVRDWGSPGKGVFVDASLVGFAMLGPSGAFAGVRGVGCAVSADALALTTLWVDPAYRRTGIGKLLVHTALREAASSGSRALEAVGASPHAGEPWCLAPAAFFQAQGFTLRAERQRVRLLRLDLRRTARWQGSLEEALARAREALRQGERAPAPSAPASGRMASAVGEPRGGRGNPARDAVRAGHGALDAVDGALDTGH